MVCRRLSFGFHNHFFKVHQSQQSLHACSSMQTSYHAYILATPRMWVTKIAASITSPVSVETSAVCASHCAHIVTSGRSLSFEQRISCRIIADVWRSAHIQCGIPLVANQLSLLKKLLGVSSFLDPQLAIEELRWLIAHNKCSSRNHHASDVLLFRILVGTCAWAPDKVFHRVGVRKPMPGT